MKNQKTVQKYLNALILIYDEIKEHPGCSLSALCRYLKISSNVVTTLVKGGVINNEGTQVRPKYKWASRRPDIKMAEELVKRIRRAQNERNRNKKYPNDKYGNIGIHPENELKRQEEKNKPAKSQ